MLFNVVLFSLYIPTVSLSSEITSFTFTLFVVSPPEYIPIAEFETSNLSPLISLSFSK